MMHLLIIALAVSVFIHDAYGLAPGFNILTPTLITASTILPLFAVAAFVHLWLARCGRKIDRTGSPVYLASADTVIGMSRILIVVVTAASILVLGWLDVVREFVGDWVLIDEAVAVAPALLAIAAGWGSYFPIDARVRHARLFAAVERGETVYPPRTPGEYLLDQLRHQMLIVLLPIGLLMAWGETLVFLTPTIARWVGEGGERQPAFAVRLADVVAILQLAGAVIILAVSPALMRHVWSTAPLGPGALRDRLESLCARHRVRHRGLLVWRTHGTMINGAVMGLFGGLRYILLTDALLDSLPDEQVEAVMAHEIAHVKKRHLPWLMGILIVAIAAAGSVAGVLAFGATLALGAAIGAPGAIGRLLELGAILLAGFVGLWVFGFVSRAFERQADAFAVQHMSGLTADRKAARGLVVTPEAARAMIGALDSVADLNLVPRRKFTWRHGSIADRQRRIARLVGRPALNLPIDRRVRMIKAASAVGMLALAASVIANWMLTG